MVRRSLVLALVPALALASSACSSSPGAGGAGGSSPTPPAKASYSLAFTTAPGEETHWCQYVKLPKSDTGEVLVTGYDWSWTEMHHWALYRTTADLPKDISFDQPFDCFQPGAMKHAEFASLVLAAGATGEQNFPAGTGFGFASEEVVIVQVHTVNTTSADIHPTLDMSLTVAEPGAVQNRLGLIQFYDPYIVVPAKTEARAGMRCAIPQDMTVVFGTTHQHTRGTGVDVFLDEPSAAPAASPFLTSKDWEHPNVIDASMKLKAGSHIRTSCSYLGDNQDVIQGQDKTDNEMCMFIGYYYPLIPADQGGAQFENCIQTPISGGVGDSYGTGVKTCSESLACIQTCPPGDAPRPGDGKVDVGKCWQTCLVDSCPSASAPLNALGQCVGDKCGAECSGGSGCPACVVKNCGGEFSACQSSTCAK